ncbi:MAG: glycosyltransferase [Roseateles sp.]|uniref:glycosyltransferase n=1 Tax=Roseateles sp. TaxID=1971397 RepID=UPI0039EC1AAE
MKKMAVALLGDYFTSWMGGANLLGSVLDALLRAAPAQNASVHLLMRHTNLPTSVQDGVTDFLPLRREQLNAGGPLKCLLDAAPQLEHVLFYRDLPATAQVLGLDVIGPTGENLGADFPLPWAAYIPDFQHQHLPHFFTQRERFGRDQQFRALVENSWGVFVNSGAVLADIQRFYGAAANRQRLYRFPQIFSDVAAGWQDGQATRDRLGITTPYVISCSQRWLHKQHELIITAFAEHLQAHPASPLRLVFTGERGDYRKADYAQQIERLIDHFQLRGRIHDLGLIDRHDQLQLIAGAQALVQASLFEGGPGASGVLEAALLGVPVLSSDIEVNRELTFGALQFFDRHRASSLAALLATLPLTAVERDPPYEADHIDHLHAGGGLQLLASLRSLAAAGRRPA